MPDTLIQNAVIYDGTGLPPYRSDVLLRGHSIAKMGDIPQGEYAQVVEGNGLALAPGFINTHSHMDLEMFRGASFSASIRQGITTECLGQDGSSVAPLTDALVGELADNMAPLAGTLDRPYFWRDFASYMAEVDRTKPDVRFVSLVGHGTIRMNVMGNDNRAPSPQELEAMKDLLAVCMEQGAKGLSLGLEYPPGSYGKTAELTEMAKVVAKHDGLIMVHMRDEKYLLAQSIDEVSDIVKNSNVRMHISHLKVVGKSNGEILRQGIRQIEALQASGFDVTFDQYPWTATCTGLKICVPQWAYEGGEQGFQNRLTDPAEYKKVLAETKEGIEAREGGENIIIASVPTEEYAWMSGKTLDEISRKLGLSVAEAALHILQHEGPAVVAVYFSLNEEDVIYAMQSPYQCVCTDGIVGAHPHPRLYASFPRFLGHYVRDMKLMPLEKAIHKITMEPARRLRLWDRGIIREGMSADLVLFSPSTIMNVNNYSEPDIPPVGIEKVWVRGDLKFSL